MGVSELAKNAFDKALQAWTELIEVKSLVKHLAEDVDRLRQDMRGQQSAFEQRIEDRISRQDTRIDDAHRVASAAEGMCRGAVTEAFSVVVKEHVKDEARLTAQQTTLKGLPGETQ